MNRPGQSGSSPSIHVQWLNRRDAAGRADDAVSLCQKALQIVTELCLAGYVDRDKCADLFPLESSSAGKGHAGKPQQE